MTAYYNEIDPFAAQWLRNLIDANLIAPGDVDERSIEDICPNELDGYTQCHFFAGIGAWSYALRLAGWPDDRPVWTGSCPCQPYSQAGKGEGFADERHLWPSWLHLIEQQKPSEIFGEQSSSKAALDWVDLVQNDLESQGYAFGVADLSAAGAGAPHIRQRFYFGATNTNSKRSSRPNWNGQPRAQETPSAWGSIARTHAERGWAAWLSESGTPALIDGAPGRVGRTRAYGNCIVPQVAQAFIESYMECKP